MRPIVLEKDENGRIKITVDEIKKIVDEAYNSGYEDAKKYNYAPITVAPYITTPWYYNTHGITCNSDPTNTQYTGVKSVQELL